MKTILNTAKWLFPRPFKRYVKQSLLDYLEAPTIEWSLNNLRRVGFRPKTILDIGAYKGEWTEMARGVFPEASFLLLEGQEGRKADLDAVKARHAGKVDYRIMVLGPENRDEVVFNEMPSAPTGSSVLSTWKGQGTRPVSRRMQTLDTVMDQAGVKSAELIKLDVQGYELEVLKGGAKTLKGAQAVLMEVSLIDLYQNNPLLHDVVAFMKERGFVAYDICALARRPLDRALVQVDIIFASPASSLLKTKEYAAGDPLF